MFCFNPRACGRRDLSHVTHYAERQCFNPRACGRRDHKPCNTGCPHPSFNPRACGRRDCLRHAAYMSARVSIHAPAGGATHFKLTNVNSIRFQSTRLREARPSVSPLMNTVGMFQSTRLREARHT